jgi:hypothetical protein
MTASLALDDRQALAAAVAQLERPNFLARLAQYAGTPVDAAIKYLPRTVSRPIKDVVKSAMFRCLDVAINSLDEDEAPPPDWAGKLITGVTGGVGGFFGMYALPIELPLTTTLMLRTIAGIAREAGEDMAALEPRLACLEVFALGGGRPEPGGRSREQLSLEYYGMRTLLGSITRDLSRQVLERGAVHASSPVMARLVGEIVARFGITISDRMGASIVPVIGAIGGATVNVIFMDHFQRVARGHFTVRRLERAYGAADIRLYYEATADALAGRPAKGQ